MRVAKEKIIKNFIVIFSLLMVIGIFFQVNITQAKAAKFSIAYNSLTLKKGEGKKLKTTKLPSSKAKIKWSTSNKYAATVSKKGKVKAVNYGSATIKAVCNKRVASCVVKVPDTKRAVVLNTGSVALTENSTYQLTATSATPVKYHSGNEEVAVVSSTGLIRAVNPGIVVITAKTATGYANCTVTVNSSDVEKETGSSATDKKAVAIRRLTKNNNIVYDDIVWAKGKTISFKIANLNVSNIRSCTWSTSDKTILTVPVSNSQCVIQSSAETLKAGDVTVTATVTDVNGNTMTYSNYVHVSDPVINTNTLNLLGTSAGSNRQQFVTFTGLTPYSTIKWTNSNTACATYSAYHTKLAVWGINAGSGILTATVDGKTFYVNYNVKMPVFHKITSVLAKGKTAEIKIDGIDGMTPLFSSRNSNIATVTADGVVTGINSGVTYVDVHIGTMNFNYRVEVAAKGMKKIINRADYIVNHWKYSQAKRMKSGYYDCSSLVWKGYKSYKKYQKKLGSKKRALPAGDLFDYLYSKGQIVSLGYTGVDDLKPGDLIFYGDYNSACKYSTPGRTLDIYHVSMYAGAGKVVEKGGQTINYNNLQHIVGIGRVVN